jgi:hypothetical protein
MLSRGLRIGRLRRSVSRNWGIRPGYAARDDMSSFEDEAQPEVLHPPAVYAFAFHIARRYGVRNIIDIGCGRARELVQLHPEFHVVGIDLGPNIDYCNAQYPFGTWFDVDLTEPNPLPISGDVAADSVVICSNVIERLKSPRSLLRNLRLMSKTCRAVIITTPDRELAGGVNELGPPGDPRHVREWTLPEFQRLLQGAGLSVSFIGLTQNDAGTTARHTILAVCENQTLPPVQQARDDFLVLAVLPAYNEEDIIESTVRDLLGQGVAVHLIDNWSTDRTLEYAIAAGRSSRFTWERFPASGPSGVYQWRELLDRVDHVAAASDADWCIAQDVDERRSSPWPGFTLRDALFTVEQRGFNAVDHTVLNFVPTTDAFQDRRDPEQHLRHFELGQFEGHFVQVRAWKNSGACVGLPSTGGHTIRRPDLRIFPYNFLLKHYPIRSQRHGDRKVFRDRRPRWSPEERALGWHVQYDALDTTSTFIREPESLIEFSAAFFTTHLVERLTHAHGPQTVPVTDATFDERRYLAANSDVARAVQRGVFVSGRAHFDLYGKTENRRQRLQQTPSTGASSGN